MEQSRAVEIAEKLREDDKDVVYMSTVKRIHATVTSECLAYNSLTLFRPDFFGLLRPGGGGGDSIQ